MKFILVGSTLLIVFLFKVNALCARNTTEPFPNPSITHSSGSGTPTPSGVGPGVPDPTPGPNPTTAPPSTNNTVRKSKPCGKYIKTIVVHIMNYCGFHDSVGKVLCLSHCFRKHKCKDGACVKNESGERVCKCICNRSGIDVIITKQPCTYDRTYKGIIIKSLFYYFELQKEMMVQ